MGAKYFADSKAAEKRAVSFLDFVKHDAEAVYLVGDVLDYWFEYKHVVPRGYVRFFGKLAELADMGVKVTWLIGNHDIWIFDYLPEELGIEVVDGVLERVIQGKRCLITHGDGVGRMSWQFRFIRWLFRNRICQKMYASIHPRWSVPLAYGWSNNNRGTHPEALPYQGAENEPLIEYARSHAATNPNIDYYIFGHRHILLEEKLTHNATAIILGEWLSMYSFAKMRAGRITLHRFEDVLSKFKHTL